MSFERFIERVLKHEGGYVDHPSDPGGATNFGITEKVARAHGYTGHMRDFPRAQAIDIYKKTYWTGPRIAELPSALAFQAFDAAVNHGVTRASQWVQQAVGQHPDGVIGPKTLMAAAGTSQIDAILQFNERRLAFYAGLGTFATFGRGWVRRVAENMGHAADDL